MKPRPTLTPKPDFFQAHQQMLSSQHFMGTLACFFEGGLGGGGGCRPHKGGPRSGVVVACPIPLARPCHHAKSLWVHDSVQMLGDGQIENAGSEASTVFEYIGTDLFLEWEWGLRVHLGKILEPKTPWNPEKTPCRPRPLPAAADPGTQNETTIMRKPSLIHRSAN